MRSKVVFKLSSEESAIVDNFCRQVGIDRNNVAKKALFMVMNQAYDRATKLQEEIENASRSGDTGGNMEVKAVDVQDSNSNVSTESSQV